jgi:serine/threonine-protein kinase
VPRIIGIGTGLLVLEERIEMKIKVDGYEPVKVLGEGGMGTVLLVKETRTGREAALKTLRPDHVGNPRLLRRFCREVRLMADLEHPNIVHCVTYDLRAVPPWVMMEYCRVGSLDQFKAKVNPLQGG